MARFLAKEKTEDEEYRSPTDIAMDRELDRIDAERK